MPRRNDLSALALPVRRAFIELTERLAPLTLRPYEVYRSDEDQLRVFNLGVSKARPGESPHQWGLAVDFVFYDPTKGWHWPKSTDSRWAEMHDIVDSFDILSTKAGPDIPWDSPHVEAINWRSWKHDLWREKLRASEAKGFID